MGCAGGAVYGRRFARGGLARVLVALVVAVSGLAVGSRAAWAEFQPGIGVRDPRGLFTEAVLTGIGAGRSVSGYDAPAGFDPLGGYPSTIPSGSVAHAVSYAGTLTIADPVSGRTGLTYCIDLNTDTEEGVHYELGVWSDAHVPNLGYVEYILLHYYPHTSLPAGATDADRAAAVQAAIWFFSDAYILATSSPVRALTEQIVADALANGPATEPQTPTLTVTPDHLAAPATGEIVGPFTVTSDGPSVVHSDGVEVFTDAQGRHRLADGATVQPGAKLWARSVSSTLPQGFVLERVVSEPVGTVLLYDGTNPGMTEAQKLVLAQETELVARAGALLTPYAAGRLSLTKHIRGPGAGLQGPVTLTVECRGTATQRYTVTVPAAATGAHTRLLSGIHAGDHCAITETASGANAQARLDGPPLIHPATVTITADQTAHATATDTYARIQHHRPPHHKRSPAPIMVTGRLTG